MERKIILSLLIAIFIAIPVVSSVSSTSGEFIVNPEVVYINWTDASGLGSYSANITITWNASYSGKVIVENSTDTSWLVPSFIPGASIDRCGFAENIAADSSFLCAKIYVLPGNIIEFSNIEEKNITLKVDTTFLPSGRYFTYQNLTIRNETNSTENVTILVYLDVPIKVEGRKGVFGRYENVESIKSEEQIKEIQYKIKAHASPEDAHFFYFNTSAVENTTSILIKLSSSADVDMFLLDENNNFIASSVNKNLREEEIIYLRPSPGYWKILIYGNFSQDITYEGNIVYSTLNLVDTSENEINIIDFGSINTTNTSDTTKTIIFEIKNQGNFTYRNVKENIVLYRKIIFNGSGNNTFSFLVPRDQTVRAVLKWNGTTNYKLYLYDSSNELLGFSENMHEYSKILNLENKQIVEAHGNAGLWKAKVEGDGNKSFILEIMILENASKWFTSNYSSHSGFFNYSHSPNSSVTVNLTLSVPKNAIDGEYEGFIEYRENNGKGAGIRIPINFSVLSAVITGNNTFYSITKNYNENIYRGRTFNLTIYLNNTGRLNATNITPQISNLICGNSHIWVKAVYFNSSLISQGESFTLPSNSWGILEIEINTSTANETCVHKGEIILNASSSENPVRPRSIFKILININITDKINAVISGFSPSLVNVFSSEANVTVNTLDLTYANGTIFNEELYLENIICVKLVHKNISYSTSCLNKSYYGVATAIDVSINISEGKYKFNFTVLKGIYGGYYDVLISFKTKDGKLKGEAKGLLAVEGEALFLEIISAPSSMQNGTEALLNIKITNYGLNKSEGAKLTIESNLISEITKLSEVSGCEKAAVSGKTITFTLKAQTSCKIAMKIKASSSSGKGKVYLKGTKGLWVNSEDFYLKVKKPSSSKKEKDGEQNQKNNTKWVKNITFLQYPSLIQIKQGESKLILVFVNNTGNLTLYDLELKVEGINKTWVIVSPKTDLSPGKNHGFKVNITIPENAKIEKKTIKFIVIAKNFSKSVEATLEILPSETFKQEVEQNFTFLKQIYENITSLYNSYKEKGVEKQEIENKLSTIETLLSQAQDLIKKNDYTSAAAILSTLTNLLNETNTMVNGLEKELQEKSKQKVITIIILIFVAIGIGFLIYLLLPPPHGYEPKKGFRYVPPHHRGKPRLKKLLDELKEIKNKILEKIKLYTHRSS